VIRIVRVLFCSSRWHNIVPNQRKEKKKRKKRKKKKKKEEEKRVKKRRKNEKRKKKKKKEKKREKKEKKMVITITHNRQNIYTIALCVLITTHQCTMYRPFEW
jgi:hypothetical protein